MPNVISIVVPSYARQSVCIETYKIEANDQVEHIYCVGSAIPYLWPINHLKSKILHFPDSPILYRLKKGVEEASCDSVMMKSDDDVIINTRTWSDECEFKEIVIPKIYFTNGKNIQRCLSQITFHNTRFDLQEWLHAAIESNLVCWSAIYPKTLLLEILNLPGMAYSSFLAEKMILCFLYGRGYNIRISSDTILLRNKRLISQAQGLRTALYGQVRGLRIAEEVNEFMTCTIRNCDSASRKRVLERYREKVITRFKKQPDNFESSALRDIMTEKNNIKFFKKKYNRICQIRDRPPKNAAILDYITRSNAFYEDALCGT